jgi:hypothetical protein
MNIKIGMSSMSTTNDNNSFSNALLLEIISQVEGANLLGIMNSNDVAHTFIANNILLLVQQFIEHKPYQQVLWELYAPNTVEQFKTNLKIQAFASSTNFGFMMNLVGSQDIKERKILFGMLYYNTNYYNCCPIDNDDRFQFIIDLIGDLSNDNIKYLIQVISISPLLANIQEIEDDIKFICENNQQIEFLDYLREMLNLPNIYIRHVDIIHSFISEQDKLELFKEYCRAGIWSEHAMDFIEENIIMTDQRKKIYFALVGRVNNLCLHECVEECIMRNLNINPLTPEEQETLNYELMFNRNECGLPHN